jgi:hypothetical protein
MRTLLFIVLIFCKLNSFGQEKILLEDYTLSIDSNNSVSSILIHFRIFFNQDTTIVAYLSKDQLLEFKKSNLLSSEIRNFYNFFSFKIVSMNNDTIINEGHKFTINSLTKLKKVKIKVPHKQGIKVSYEILRESTNLKNKINAAKVYQVFVKYLIVETSELNGVYENLPNSPFNKKKSMQFIIKMSNFIFN